MSGMFPSIFIPTSGYGDRINPQTGLLTFHSGQDYSAPLGTLVPAVEDGNVVYSGFNATTGYTVIVQNGIGDYNLYAHMAATDLAKVGDYVNPGETVGLVGATGNVRINNK